MAVHYPGNTGGKLQFWNYFFHKNKTGPSGIPAYILQVHFNVEINPSTDIVINDLLHVRL